MIGKYCQAKLSSLKPQLNLSLSLIFAARPSAIHNPESAIQRRYFSYTIPSNNTFGSELQILGCSSVKL